MSVQSLRAWFLRNLLEAAERELGPAAVAALPQRVPERFKANLSLDRLRASAALDAVPLDEGEETVQAFEQALGDASGKLLERVACEMFARQLVQAAAAVRVGDLFGTIARLRGPLEHPFIDASVTFELSRTPFGFSLTVGVVGRPRATRILGHVAAGAIHAAERFAREAHTDPLRVETEILPDRARVDARFRRASTAPPPAPEPAPTSRRPLAPRVVPSLSDEVSRILNPKLGIEITERRKSTEPPPAAPSDTPAAPASTRPSWRPPRGDD
ncbi:MAG TPA: hypothetical protein VGK73_13355 [Polyangiaceae bacterium]